MTILILGGHGFLGTHLANEFANSKYDVIAQSRRDGLDLRDISETRNVIAQISPDIIINSAAHVGSLHYVTTNAAEVISDNSQMAINLYKAVAELNRDITIINPLSNCSYPGDSEVQFESEWLSGEVHESIFSYGNSKRFIYNLSVCYNLQYEIKSVNLLIPNTFGPGDSADPNKTHALNGMIIRMILAKRSDEKEFEIWGSGKPIREWAYVSDVTKIMSKSLTLKENLIYPVNIAQNKGYSIKQSAELIAEAVEFDGNLIFNTKYQDGAPVKILDDSKFKEIFPNFEYYDHKEGIIDTVKYYEKKLQEDY